jgi:hypothetical protein
MIRKFQIANCRLQIEDSETETKNPFAENY